MPATKNTPLECRTLEEGGRRRGEGPGGIGLGQHSKAHLWRLASEGKPEPLCSLVEILLYLLFCWSKGCAYNSQGLQELMQRGLSGAYSWVRWQSSASGLFIFVFSTTTPTTTPPIVIETVQFASTWRKQELKCNVSWMDTEAAAAHNSILHSLSVFSTMASIDGTDLNDEKCNIANI